MARVAKSPQRTGIESRVGADGIERHRAEVRVPGTKRKARSKWTTSLAEARSARAQLLLQAQAGALATSTMPTVREAWEAFYSQALDGRAWTRSGTPYAPKTLRGYEEKMRLYVLPVFGGVPIDRVRRSQLQLFIDETAALQTGQSARNTATPIQALYRHLLARYDELADPTHGLQLPRGSKPRDRIATPDELAALLAELEGQDAVVFALAALAGLRHGEVRALDVGHVLLDARAIEVRSSLDPIAGPKDPKSYAGERLVPIFDPLLPLLEAHRESLPAGASGPFLPGPGRWGRVNVVHAQERSYDKWSEAKLEALGMHEARHTFASTLIVAGYDVASVSEWIGHAQPSTTLDRYVKPLRRRGVDPEAARDFLGPLPWRAGQAV